MSAHAEILPEADAIHAMYVTLALAADRLKSDAHRLDSSKAVSAGRLIQRMEDASDGLFDVLTIASGYCGSDAADAAIKRGWAERDAANEAKVVAS